MTKRVMVVADRGVTLGIPAAARIRAQSGGVSQNDTWLITSGSDTPILADDDGRWKIQTQQRGRDRELR